MKLHIKLICVSFLALVSGMAFAQTPECITVEASYSMDLEDSAKLTGKALVVYQGDAFHMSGDGIEIYCDGTDVWTLDIAAGEVYIEPLLSENVEYMHKAARKLAGMRDGSSGNFETPDGQIVKVKVISKKKSGGKDISSFRPKYDSSWVVTDLR